jgi:hypothetical protein
VKTRIAAKNVTFKLWNIQQLAEQNFATVTMEEWAANMLKLRKKSTWVVSMRWTASWKES